MIHVSARLDKFDRLSLGSFPTPVHEIQQANGTSLWIKDDGACSDYYGGNKIRKLEYLLAEARRKGTQRLVVHGDTGSHNVLACSLHGRRCGFEVTAVVFPLREDDEARNGMRKLAASGVSLVLHRNMLSTILHAHLLGMKRSSYLVPLGSSSPLTTIGYVRAAVELCQQIEEGSLPAPEKIFIAHATGGSVAGLLIGLAMMQSPVRVVAVQTAESFIAGHRPLARLVRRTLDYLSLESDLFGRSLQRLERIDDRFMGRGYRDIPSEALMAVQLMDTHGLHLEPIFTGKAMAALLAEANVSSSGRLLFWNTHDQQMNKA